ncbi:MAG: zonular occludens toxin domain-containing protein [Zhongshania sp.]|uniref:zonular occludens toxin domain-containing protein n=1 Tax=Zhongshania sp. TaxID=1971902 RepID=UPI002604D638|nr:zonular occludens toxin domain-containing protein [Zhongshania sp.]MDF1694099.1 zonular occludens toxin domain-containing protein [Zhongshania sp.]
MAVYFITGKLGAGKSIIAMKKIREKLVAGRKVATNLDINLSQLLGRNAKKTRLVRIPDKPSLEDLIILGKGNRSYDENLNGLLVLDECGTWFNSRSWGDKTRQELINWFLHSRKLGWDIIFIVQDFSIIDKQARTALAEHLVICRRTDRLNIPFIGGIFKMITGSRLPVPKAHLAIVNYGASQNAVKVDTWTEIGTSLYSCYDTKQQFSEFYPHQVHSILPPWHTHGRHTVEYTWKNIMRITKIYLRKWSRLKALGIGIVVTYSIMVFIQDKPEELQDLQQKTMEQLAPISLEEKFSGYKIKSYANFPSQPSTYNFASETGEVTTAEALRLKGIKVTSRGPCEALLVKGDEYVSIYCQ